MFDGLKLNADIMQTFKAMPLEAVGRLVMAAYRYSETGAVADLPDSEIYLFTLMRAQIDRERENSRKRAEINARNGAKGGRPRKTAETPQESAEAPGKASIRQEPQTGLRAHETAANELYNADVAEVLQYYEEHVQPDANPRCLQELAGFVKRLGKHVCMELINDALDSGKRNWSYMRAMMKDKAQKGIRTVADLDKDRESYRPQKPNKITAANGGQPNASAIKASQNWMDSYIDGE